MFDLRITDLSKTEEEGNVDFIALTNEQWAMIKANIDLLKNHEKCELMYAEDFRKQIDKARADAFKDTELFREMFLEELVQQSCDREEARMYKDICAMSWSKFLKEKKE